MNPLHPVGRGLRRSCGRHLAAPSRHRRICPSYFPSCFHRCRNPSGGRQHLHQTRHSSGFGALEPRRSKSRGHGAQSGIPDRLLHLIPLRVPVRRTTCPDPQRSLLETLYRSAVGNQRNDQFMPDVDQKTAARAARQAHIHDEIMQWQHGYATPISQRSKAVSGGQRQQLCPAMALAGDPHILVIDEPNSVLDLRSKALVQEFLAAITGQLTLIIRAHRISTLCPCKRVMVLRNGRSEEFKPASEVSTSNEFYRNAITLSRITRDEQSSRLTLYGASHKPWLPLQ